MVSVPAIAVTAVVASTIVAVIVAVSAIIAVSTVVAIVPAVVTIAVLVATVIVAAASVVVAVATIIAVPAAVVPFAGRGAAARLVGATGAVFADGTLAKVVLQLGCSFCEFALCLIQGSSESKEQIQARKTP